MLARKLFGMRKLPDLQPGRFTQLDNGIDVAHCFTNAVANIHMHRTMIIAVKEEAAAIFLGNLWHPRMMIGMRSRASNSKRRLSSNGPRCYPFIA